MGENFFYEGWIEICFEPSRLFRIIPREQNSFPFAAKMKTGRHIDDHRKALRQLIEWFSRDKLTSQRLDRQFRAGHLRDLCGPGAGRIDDHAGRDETASCLDASHAAPPPRC